MKNILFGFLLIAAVPAFASQSLDCQMSKNGRVVDRQSATISTSTSEPILFLFGYGSIQGFVRDFFKDASMRHIELQLTYKDGVSWGKGESQADYFSMATGSIAQVSLEEPNFGTLYSIECFVSSSDQVNLPAQVFAFSTIKDVYGYSTANDFCNEFNSYSCFDRVKQRAKSQAIQDAKWQCDMQHGRTNEFMASCYDSCSPMYIPPGSATDQMVTCSANCTLRCEIN